MSRPVFRVVRDVADPAEQLLTALERFAPPADGEPLAYLEVGSDEFHGDITLTVGQVDDLAALLTAGRPVVGGRR